MDQDTAILLDRGTFTDANWNIDATRAMRSIYYPISIMEMYHM